MQLFILLAATLWVVFAQSGFNCSSNPVLVQTGTCYRQTYTLAGNGTNCTNQFTWVNSSYPYFILEMLDGGAGDAVSVAWGQNSTSLDSSGRLSIQQLLVSVQPSLTISITTAASSTLKGAYSLCARITGTELERTNVMISYGSQGTVIQKFTPTNGLTNWRAPHMWQFTGQNQIALIAAAYEPPTFCNGCLENIYFYEGIEANAVFVGTGTTISNRLYVSQNNTVTVILVDDGDRSDYMAVAINEYQNYEDCSTKQAFFFSSSATSFPAISVQDQACVTVFNQCDEKAVCDMPLLTNATYTGDPDYSSFIAYAGLAAPDAFFQSVIDKTGIAYLSSPNLRLYQLPQQLQGNVRTFQLYNNTGSFSLGQGFYKAFTYRRGSLSSNQYPFYSSEQQRGNHITFDTALYDYQINITIMACDSMNSSIVITTPQQVFTYSSITKDFVGAVIQVNVTANSTCEIEVFGNNNASYGTQFWFDITAQDGVVRTTTTTTTTTSTLTTTTAALTTPAYTTRTTSPSSTTPKGALPVSILQSLVVLIVSLLFA